MLAMRSEALSPKSATPLILQAGSAIPRRLPPRPSCPTAPSKRLILRRCRRVRLRLRLRRAKPPSPIRCPPIAHSPAIAVKCCGEGPKRLRRRHLPPRVRLHSRKRNLRQRPPRCPILRRRQQHRPPLRLNLQRQRPQLQYPSYLRRHALPPPVRLRRPHRQARVNQPFLLVRAANA